MTSRASFMEIDDSLTREELIKRIETDKQLRNLDLSGIELDDIDFSGCILENVYFAQVNMNGRQLKNLNFKGASLNKVYFYNTSLINCDFDGKATHLLAVSFWKCELLNCRFRNARLEWSDFRYAEIHRSTFENAQLIFCDCYKCVFDGIIVFRNARIENCSLYNAYFSEGATIRRANLVRGRLLQEYKDQYLAFLKQWEERGPGKRMNDQGIESEWDPNTSLQSRFADAEDIFKTLNGLWMSKGYYADANWAYVKGRKLERKRMIVELFHGDLSLADRLMHPFYILWNYTTDWLFGYGESILRMVITYLIMVFLFAYVYYRMPGVSLLHYSDALGVSLKNMVAMGAEEVNGISPLVDFLNVIQTTVGILITGIFGFILGNKIRNQ